MRTYRVGPGIYLTTIVGMFMLLAAGVSVYYFFMLPLTTTPIIYAEANVGGESAGVNIAFPRSKSLWMIVNARLPPSIQTVGPTTVEVLVDGSPLLQVTCPERSFSGTGALCSVNVPFSDLPLGSHRVELILRQTRIGGVYTGGYPVMTVQYQTLGDAVYIYSVQSQTIDLSRVVAR